VTLQIRTVSESQTRAGGTDRRTAHFDAADAGFVPAIYAIFDDMEDSSGD